MVVQDVVSHFPRGPHGLTGVTQEVVDHDVHPLPGVGEATSKRIVILDRHNAGRIYIE